MQTFGLDFQVSGKSPLASYYSGGIWFLMNSDTPCLYLQTNCTRRFYTSLQTLCVLEIDIAIKSNMPLTRWRRLIQGVKRAGP